MAIDEHSASNFEEIIEMRWEKDGLFVEINGAISVDGAGAIWEVHWAPNLKDIPVALFSLQVPKSDNEGFAKLRQAISDWASRNGFRPKR